MPMVRYSRQRDLILSELRGRCDHPTAEMIYIKLKAENASLSLGTVYRNLKKLAKDDVIRQMDFSIERYDADTERHPHMRCLECGGVFDIPAQYDGDIDERACSSGQCEVFWHELIFYGRCGECLRKGGNNTVGITGKSKNEDTL